MSELSMPLANDQAMFWQSYSVSRKNEFEHVETYHNDSFSKPFPSEVR